MGSSNSLKRAIGDPDVVRIGVAADIRCKQATWDETVLAVVAEKGAVFLLHDSIIYQDDMGIGGLDVPFIKSRKEATVVLAGVVMHVRSSPLPMDSYNDIAGLLSRPQFLANGQRTSPLGHTAILAEDLGFWKPVVNSFWQICNIVFDCSFHEDHQYFKDGVAVAACG
ncbi:hypothetical protein BSKO_04915 [Bryopsis sp. KO-2023]|nr:hypothetical protein BSKO_04915 [Bryopsis sp. KO-2023]